ncbi:MAG: hypothetical protein KJ063_07540 [Anaerolineae bacterium]|nr:hypothetical protein [Anaerolineae bacterium]
MTTVTFADPTQYAFAQEFVRPLLNQGVRVMADPHQQTLTTDHAVINLLFQRLAQTNSTILPYLGNHSDQWLLVGQDRRALDEMLARVTAFIIPSYAEFSDGERLAQLSLFDPQKNKLNQLGAQFYNLGYYKWASPVKYRETILDRLLLWLKLQEAQPAIELPPQFTYRDLHQLFTQALSDKEWLTAENVLSEMRRLNMTTAENLQFLHVQWLAEQQKWQEIWDDSDFEMLARLRMPRDVRAAMLTAFHHINLLALERVGEWETAVAVFQEMQGRLGALLVGRFGVTQAPVLRVFGYQALLNNDAATLESLLAEASDSETIHCLNQLKSRLAPADTKTSALTQNPLQQAVLALKANDYDAVIAVIKAIDDTTARVLLAIEIAYHSRDDLLIQEAWTIYQSLSPEQKQALIADGRYVGIYLDFLRESNTDQPKSIWGADEGKARDNAWKGICDIEYYLRRLVEARYAKKFGDAWESSIKPELREKWIATQAKDEKTFVRYGMSKSSLLDYSYLGDLVGLINAQWSLFEDIFGAGKAAKQEFTRVTEAIIRVRNPLAHNRDVPLNELRRADVYCTDLLMQLQTK